MEQTKFAATKFTIPSPVRTMVARPHLVAALDEGTYRVGVVSAPAGFGKTALLATWAADRSEPVAWLSCDASDTEPTRFLQGLLTAIGTQRPGIGGDARVLLERAPTGGPEIAISLANDLTALPGPMTIVIDDLHLADPTPTMLGGLVEALPASVRLVVGSRVDPPLPLGRLRVAGTLLEMHGDDLSFSTEETAAVLHSHDVTLDRQGLELLYDLTEGWPAGVQLAALALERDVDRAEFLSAFASTDRAVADFLVGEVLDRQPEALVEFLYATSVLDGFDADLCDAVTGRDDAGTLLEQLVAANLFVVRVGVGAGWYRYHHLFRAFLQARLRAGGRVGWRTAHRRAARAFEARDDIVNALHHATVSGDEEEAVGLIQRTLRRWFNTIDPEVTNAAVRQWLHRRGRESLITEPSQVLEFLVPLLATAPGEEVRWWLTEIEAAHPDPSPTLTAWLHGCWAEHHLCRGEADEALGQATTAMDAIGWAPPGEGAIAALPSVLVQAILQRNDAAGASAALDTVEAHHGGNPVVDGVRKPALRSWAAVLGGDLRRGERAATSAIAAADLLALPASDSGRIFAGLSLATLHLERHEDEAARQLLAQLRRDADLSGRPPLQSLVALESSRFARIVGDGATAAEDLTLARLLLANPSSSIVSRFDVEAARQALEFQPSTAPALIDALDDSPRATLLRIRDALAAGDPRSAASLLAELPPPVTRRQQITRFVLTALIQLPHDVEAANRELHQALDLARPEGYRRSILAHGPQVLPLLLSFAPSVDLEPYVDELIEAASAATPPMRPQPVTSLVEPLSDREVTVLRYLCSRLTYHEIAAAIFVSHNTLKTHVSSIYRKLAVGSRRDAVEAGRALRLI